MREARGERSAERRPGRRRPGPGVDLGGCPGVAPPAGLAGADGGPAAPLARPGAGPADHSVPAAALAADQHRGARRGGRRDDGQRPAGGGAARAGRGGGGHRLLLRARHRSGLGAVLQHGGQRPDGAPGPGARGVRGERRARAGRLGRLGGLGVRRRGRGHLRLADPDDRGLRLRAGRGDRGPVGERGGGGRGRGLADHRAIRPGGQRSLRRRRHRHRAVPALPGDRRGLRRGRPLRDADPERNPVMNVEITDLTRRFGRNQAVAGVSLQAGPGVFGLLGPNGAGKTTLLRMMATVIPPTTGRLRLLDRDPGAYGPRREVRRRLGYLPQNLGYYPGFTVAEFVEYFALLKEMPAARVPAAVATAVERVDLCGRARAKLRTLSGGMLRRVGIAQAIVNEPELLLLDEPTAGLDPEQRVHFRVLLRELGQRATVVVSTHLVEDVGAACSQVALMDQGKVVFDGTPGELTARGTEHGTGDAPLERGYTAVLAAARA